MHKNDTLVIKRKYLRKYSSVQGMQRLFTMSMIVRTLFELLYMTSPSLSVWKQDKYVF